MMTFRAAIAGSTSSPTITAGHQTTFIEYAESNDTTGWFFKSASTGTYQEIARITRTGINWNGNTVYHTGNIPTWNQNTSGTAASISGFNNPTTSATANTIAYRDNGGDLYARYMFAVHFNQSGGNSENPTIGQIWTQNTTDNYCRKSTPAHFISQLGLITTSNIGSQSVSSATTLVSNATVSRDLYINGGASGNFGNRLLIGTTTATYTLQDTNVRPTIYMNGAYPVLTMNHTATSNTNHGPTIQFTFDGLTTGGSTSRQILIGTPGNGNHLDFGFSGGGFGSNTDYNPHRGIAGYEGVTPMRLFSNGLMVGSNGSYPSIASSISYNFQVNGTGYVSSNFTVGGTLTENSSIRYKKDIETISYGLDKVLKMRGVTYLKKENDIKEVGVIAEEIAEIFPELVNYDTEGRPDSVSYGRITGLLIEAIKDLKKEINELKNNG
jgi:hypothetical protein